MMRPGLLTAMAALVSERRLQGAPASVTAACGLGGFGSWALEHRPSSGGTRACCPEACGTFLDQGLHPSLLPDGRIHRH